MLSWYIGNHEDRRESADRGSPGTQNGQSAESAGRTSRPFDGRSAGRDRAPRFRRAKRVRAGNPEADRPFERNLRSGSNRPGRPSADRGRRYAMTLFRLLDAYRWFYAGFIIVASAQTALLAHGHMAILGSVEIL